MRPIPCKSRTYVCPLASVKDPSPASHFCGALVSLLQSVIITIPTFLQEQRKNKWLWMEARVLYENIFLSLLPSLSLIKAWRMELVGASRCILGLEHPSPPRAVVGCLVGILVPLNPGPTMMPWWAPPSGWSLEPCQGLWAQPPRWKELGSCSWNPEQGSWWSLFLPLRGPTSGRLFFHLSRKASFQQIEF